MTRKIAKVHRHHAVDTFDCGRTDLNRFLQQYALPNQHSGGSQTYVGLVDDSVVGYYALAVGSVEQDIAPERMKKGLAKHAIPIMLLAPLAVDLHLRIPVLRLLHRSFTRSYPAGTSLHPLEEASQPEMSF